MAPVLTTTSQEHDGLFMTGVFSFYQEYDAESTMAGFKNLEPDSCKCVRDYKNWNGKDCAAGFEDLNFESGVRNSTLMLVPLGL